MTILPRLLYLFNALPIPIPNSFFSRLLQMQRRFLQADKKSRIKFRLLTLPENKDGIGLPDFKKYYYATHITRLIDWHCHSQNKDWVHLEHLHNEQQLLYYPWSIHSKNSRNIDHPLVATTLNIWHKTATQHKLASIPGPLTPIA